MSSWRFKYLGQRSLLINELMEHLNQKAVDMKQSGLATAYKSCNITMYFDDQLYRKS